MIKYHILGWYIQLLFITKKEGKTSQQKQEQEWSKIVKALKEKKPQQS